MSAEHEVGRLPAGTGDDKPVVFDAPNAAVKAILTKLDQIIDWQNTVGAAIEAATTGDTLFAGLDVAAIKTAVKKLRFNF